MEENRERLRKKTETTTKVLIAIISVLFVAVGVMGFLLYDLSRKAEILTVKEQEVTVEKDLIKEELEFLLEDYEMLDTRNDSLNLAIAQEKQHIMELIDELDRVKNYNYSIQRKYEQELSSLRQIMRHYVYQIDSLDQMNKKLLAENFEIRGDRERIIGELDEVVHRHDELELIIEGASVVRATRIDFEFLNKRGRETSRSRRVEKIKTTFTLVANELAQSGSRRVYLRIIRPDSFPITEGQTLIYREKSVPYTVHRDIIYENQDLTVSVFYDVNEALILGKYDVEIYMDGEIIGQSSFIIDK
jgi:chromosome segregation ATPase